MLRQATLDQRHTIYSNHLGVLKLPMLRQATLVQTSHTLLESFRSFNPPNAEAGDVGRIRYTHSTRII